MSASASKPTDALLQIFLTATDSKYTAIRQRRTDRVSGLRDKLKEAARALRNPNTPASVGLPIHHEDYDYFKNYAENIHDNLNFPRDHRVKLSASVCPDASSCYCDDDRDCNCPTTYMLSVSLLRVSE